MNAGKFAIVIGINLVAIVLIGGGLFWYLARISAAVKTANGILLGGLAERQEANIVDHLPMDERTSSQQGYVDRRDAADRAQRTAELRDEFERGNSGEGG